MSAPTNFRNVTVNAEGLLEGEHDAFGRWVKFLGTFRGLLVKEIWDGNNNKAALEIWDESDGYGEQGYIPCQGYDWSGIRDSSPEAWARMFAVAVKYLPENEFRERLGLPQA